MPFQIKLTYKNFFVRPLIYMLRERERETADIYVQREIERSSKQEVCVRPLIYMYREREREIKQNKKFVFVR
jgi:hypothetical protein